MTAVDNPALTILGVAIVAGLVGLVAHMWIEARHRREADTHALRDMLREVYEQGRDRHEQRLVEERNVEIHAAEIGRRLTAEYLAEQPVISGGRRYASIDAWMRNLAEPTPIYDRLVAEAKAEEQAGIRRRVEELGIDWTVTP